MAANVAKPRKKSGKQSPMRQVFRRLSKNKSSVVSFYFLCFLIILALTASLFISEDMVYKQTQERRLPPSWDHLFGTDSLGRDLWVRCWEGARVSLTIGVLTAMINACVGILYGGIAGFVGGNVDNVMMRICEVLGAVPQMLWVTLLVIVMKPGLMPIIIALSATGWMGMARLFRGQVLQIKESEYVMASQCLGTGKIWIIVKHLVPNAMSPIITSLAFSIPGAIFSEAFLSYIGLGLPLPMASWGNLASNGANVFRTYPYQLIFPSILICITMLCFTLIGDALRDALDPRMRK